MKSLLLGLLLAVNALSPLNESLVDAALDGQLEKVKTALSQGAELELRFGPRQQTPLMLALYRDHNEVVKFLVEQGADVNAHNSHGQTPVIMAAIGGQQALLQLFLERGAQLEAREELGNTALMWAVYWGHIELVKSLLAKGAQVRVYNRDGNGVLHLAAQGGVVLKTRTLMAKRQAFAPNGRKQPLVLPIHEQAELLRALLAQGADPNMANLKGQTPLMLMAEKGSWEWTLPLLAAGADPSLRDQQGLSALDYARNAGQTQLLEKLQTWHPLQQPPPNLTPAAQPSPENPG